MKNRVATISMVIPLLLLIAGCGNKKESSEPVYKVEIERVTSFNGLLSSSYTGVVEEKSKTPLSFLGVGTIANIYVHEGQQVRKGDLIARIDAASAKNYYDIALLQEQKAQDAYNRFVPLNEKGIIPPIQMVEVQTALNQAKANTEIAKKNLKDNNLYAHSSGTIGKIHLTQGMNTGPGIPILDLLDINTLYVVISVPEDEISHFKQGVKATVAISAISTTINGEVKEVGVSADLLSHTYSVKIEISNSSLTVRPGMVCSATIDAESNKTGFLISAKALNKDISGNQFVYAVDENNRVSKIAVKTISLIEDKVLVTGNMTTGTIIVVSGQEKLKPQTKVSIH